MYIQASTLDDLLRAVLIKLLRTTEVISPTRGRAMEVTGVQLRLSNPRARLSRSQTKGTLFSCLGELLWYLARTNRLSFIEYYIPAYAMDSEDGRTIYGGYGPRLFRKGGTNQIKNVLKILSKSPDSRRAVIQIFDAADISRRRKEIPCTCVLQFLARGGRLHLVTYMRSNDVFLGLPHDFFAFTMLQEILARTLRLGLGEYTHSVGSLHLYVNDMSRARQYLREGWQSSKAMPSMPPEDPWNSIGKLLRAERELRVEGSTSLGVLRLGPYWSDLARILQVYRHLKTDDADATLSTMRQLSVRLYDTYVENRLEARGLSAPVNR